MLGLPVQFFLVVTSRFAFQDDGVRHDVDRYAALDNADVRGGLVVDSTELHLRDALGRHFDGADSFFRANSRVSFEALNVKLHTVGGRRFGKEKSDGVAIQDQSGACSQPAYVEALCADQTGLLANRKNHVDAGAGQALLLDDSQNLADNRDAALIVAAKHGSPVRV